MTITMPRPFFADPYFGWTFYAVLIAVAALAAYLDLRKAVVPKWLTLGALGLGFLFNITRGVLLGQSEAPLWLFSSSGPWLGGLDGFLFALIGFLSGFGIFFVMWILGTCGGGDVKLMAAVGSWIGPFLIPFVMLASIAVLVVLVIGKVLVGSFRARAVLGRLKSLPTVADVRSGNQKGRRPLRLTYSLPVAVATAAVLLWFFRVELQLTQPHLPANKVEAHAK
jgi:prepilin peptidase CpaA